MTDIQRTIKPVLAALASLALLVLNGCDYSLLTRGPTLAAWSPDGQRLAACVNNADADTAELWLVEPDTDRTKLLLSGERTRGLPHLLAPRWSVDGRRLHVLRTTEGSEGERNRAVIIAIDPAADEPREVATIHYGGSRGGLLAGSDVVVPLADGALAVQDLEDDGRYRLRRIDPDSGIDSPLTALSGSWLGISGSPDGLRLAIAHPGPGGRGATLTVVRHTGEQIGHPLDLLQTYESSDPQPVMAWSPDGRHLALIMEGRPDSSGAEEVPVPMHQHSDETEEENTATLVLVDTDHSTARIIARDLFGIPPVFSPDGSHLAWAASAGVRDADDELLLEARITTVADGRTVTASLPGMVVPLAWSADGTRVACFHGLFDDDGDAGTLYSVGRDGAGTRQISPSQEDRLAVAFAGGGRLAWISGDGAVQVVDPGSGCLLFNDGLTAAGALQAGEDHLLQKRPEAAIELLAAIDTAALDSGDAGRMAALGYASLQELQRPADAADRLDRACTELAGTEKPDLAFLVLCGALNDLGFRSPAERLVQEQLLANYPESPHAVEALWALAALKETEGDLSSSLAHLQRLLKNYPPQRTEVSRALLLAALAEAGADPARVLELAELVEQACADTGTPEHRAPRAVARYARGQALQHAQRPEEARAAYAAALSEPSETHLADGRDLDDLCWEGLLDLARDETPGPR